MSHDIDTKILGRQLGFNSDTALGRFEEAICKWVIPFLSCWMKAGPQPIPSPEEVDAVRREIARIAEKNPPLEGYEALPALLSRLAESMRFNERNLVNIHPAPHIPAIAAALVVAIQNPNNIVKDVSGPTTGLERECISWMAEHLVGFNTQDAWGNVVSGGTIANMTALMIARDYCYRKLSLPRPADVRTRGLFGFQPGVVLASAGSHYSVKKALWFLGMGDENVVSIPVAFDEVVKRRLARDANFIRGIRDTEWAGSIEAATNIDRARGKEEFERFYGGEQQPFSLQPLDSQILKALYGCFEYGVPLIGYVFTIGTTDTGTIEQPSSKALERLLDEDVFIHADAAAGGFALLHPRPRSLAIGLERVHSVTIDGHKLGHLPYPNGALILRDRGWMHEIMHEAPYLEGLAPTLEGSRPGSHVAALWMSIQDMGQTGKYEAWLGRLFGFIDSLVSGFDASGAFQVLHRVDLTTIAVAPIPNSRETRAEINRIVERMSRAISADQSEGAFLVNLDRGLSGIKVKNAPQDDSLQDIFCLRIVAANPAVGPSDADSLISYLEMQLLRARSIT